MLLALLTTAAMAWLALLLLTPQLPPHLGAAMYAIGAFICHQRPERSFHVDAIQLPVCARCLGIYGGAAVGVVVHLVAGWRLRVRPRALLLAAAAPTLVMVAMETLGFWQTSNTARAAAGIWLGAGVVVAVVPSLYTTQDARHDS